MHQHLAAARAVEDGDVDALDVHGLHVGLRVVAARVGDRVVGVAREGAPLEVLADDGRARALGHLAELEVADPDDRLVGRVVRAAG